MLAKMLVIEEGPYSYKGKNGEVNGYRLGLVDMTDEGRCSRKSFDMNLTDEQRDKFAGKLANQTIKIAITGMRVAHDGVFGLQGNILEAGAGLKSTPTSK